MNARQQVLTFIALVVLTVMVCSSSFAASYRWQDANGIVVDSLSNRCADVGSLFTDRYATYFATPPFQVVSCSSDPVGASFTLTYKRASGGNLTTTVTRLDQGIAALGVDEGEALSFMWIGLAVLIYGVGFIGGQQR